MPFPSQSDSPLPPGFLLPTPAGRDELPLHGLTLLAVEDSRYACEALRLMCQRAGARLRRAETLAAARAHLRVYRPDVVIVDLGLPDGRGEALIRDLVLSARRPQLILGTSGDPDLRASALAAGADGFLDKPLENLAKFCETLRGFMPNLAPGAQSLGSDPVISPDPLALHDDLTHAVEAMAEAGEGGNRSYVTNFLIGVAHHAHDRALADAALSAQRPEGGDLRELRAMLNHRLTEGAQAFGTKP